MLLLYWQGQVATGPGRVWGYLFWHEKSFRNVISTQEMKLCMSKKHFSQQGSNVVRTAAARINVTPSDCFLQGAMTAADIMLNIPSTKHGGHQRHKA